jgi:galactonate dehydratase
MTNHDMKRLLFLAAALLPSLGMYAQAHACATIHKFVAMESACADNVIQHEGTLYQDGYLVLNDKPGLGIELNEDYCRKRLSKGSTYFGT